MKTKGITIWERHVEKLVLGLVVVGVIAITAMQFIGEPNAVSTSAGQVGPGEIDELLDERARQLQTRLDRGSRAEVEIGDPIGAHGELMARLEQTLTPAPALPQFDLALALDIKGIGAIGRQEYPVPAVPVPQRVAVAQYADALGEGQEDIYPELRDLFPEPGQPRDLMWTTVAARFDLASLRDEFAATAGDAAIPTAWYNDRAENMVDVVVERQEWVDGAWSEPVTLDPIPGQRTLRTHIGGELDAGIRDSVLTQLADPGFQLDVVEPGFYPTRNNEWEVPAGDPAEEQERRRTRQIEYQRTLRADALDELDLLYAELAEKTGEDDPRGDRAGGKRDAPGKGGDVGGRGRRGRGDKRDAPGKGQGGAGFGAGDAGGEDEDDRPVDKDRTVNDVRKDIRTQERIVRDAEAALRDLGLGPDEFDFPAEAVDDRFAALKADAITVWAHDMTVKAGHTYRYRLAMHVYNPFFGRKRQLVDAQQSLADSFTLQSSASDWSEPVRIHPPLRVFITSAKATGTGPMDLGRATAEVYRFFDGRQWKETFSVKPGESIGEVKNVRLPEGGSAEIDFRTTLFVLDIVADMDADGNAALREGASVLLQDLETGERLGMRHPSDDLQDPDRVRLNDRAEAGRRRPA